MADDIPATPDDSDDLAEVTLDTGVRNQSLIINGWFASHADSGTPGPHVRLHATGGMDAVLKTSQIPAVIEGLKTVAERIDRKWAEWGDEYAEEVVLRAPDPQDPDVLRQKRIDQLRFTQRVADNLPEVTRLLSEAESTDAALVHIGALLDVAEEDVWRLTRVDMLSLTRAGYARRSQRLDELED